MALITKTLFKVRSHLLLGLFPCRFSELTFLHTSQVLLLRSSNLFNVSNSNSIRGTDHDTDYKLAVAKVGKRVSIINRGTKKFNKGRFNLKSLNEATLSDSNSLNSQTVFHLG